MPSKGKGRDTFTSENIPNPILWVGEEEGPLENDSWGGNSSSVIHYGHICSGPGCEDSYDSIQGIRYQCSVCPKTDFCGRCLCLPENPHNRSHQLYGCRGQAIIADYTQMSADEIKEFNSNAEAGGIEALTLESGVSESTFRVIDLQPGESNDMLQCVMRTTELETEETYEVLTNTVFRHRKGPNSWGGGYEMDIKATEELFIGEGFVSIPIALGNVLRALRSEDEVKTMYVDQICAEQEHTRNTEADAGKLSKVYSNASKTIAWIGDDDDHTETAIGLIEMLVCFYKDKTTPHPSPEELEANEELQLEDMGSNGGVSLLHFFTRAAYADAWTSQQVVLAQDPWISCGPYSVEWWKVAKVAEMLCQTPWTLAPWRIQFEWVSSIPLRANCVALTERIRQNYTATEETQRATINGATRLFATSDPCSWEFPFRDYVKEMKYDGAVHAKSSSMPSAAPISSVEKVEGPGVVYIHRYTRPATEDLSTPNSIDSIDGEGPAHNEVLHTVQENESYADGISDASHSRSTRKTGELSDRFAHDLVVTLSLSDFQRQHFAKIRSVIPGLLSLFSTFVTSRTNDAFERRAADYIQYWQSNIAELIQFYFKRDGDYTADEQGDSSGNVPLVVEPSFRAIADIPPLITDVDYACTTLKACEEYVWLLEQLRLALAEDDLGNMRGQVRQSIFEALDSSAQYGTHPEQILKLMLPWAPVRFLSDQYDMDKSPSLSDVIVLSGQGNAIEATTCGEYVKRLWPTFGDRILAFVDSAIQKSIQSTTQTGTRPYQFDIGAHRLWIRLDSQSSETMALATGSMLALTEFAEVLIWLSAACKQPSNESTVQYCTPILSIDSTRLCAKPSETVARKSFKRKGPTSRRKRAAQKRVKHKPKSDDVSNRRSVTSICLTFNTTAVDGSTENEAFSCWRDLFKNAVIARDYPIARRFNCERGLELDAAMMITLSDTESATTCNGRLVLKGYSSMLILTECSGNSTIWHFECNRRGDRVAHLQEPCEDGSLDSSSFEEAFRAGSRHFVGWAKDARHIVGTDAADYTQFDYSGCQESGAGVKLSRKFIITGGQYLNVGIKILRGDKDKPLRYVSDSFVPMVNTVGGWQFIFSDTSTRQHWMTDGASTILHLCRALLSRERVQLNITHHDHPDPMQAARDTLIDKDNRALKTMDTRVQTRIVVGPGNKTEVSTTVCNLEDLAREFYFNLEMIVDRFRGIRNDLYMPRFHAYPSHKSINGIDFKDIVCRGEMQPYSLTVHKGATDWTKLAAKLGAIYLLGAKFGELIRPSQVEQAPRCCQRNSGCCRKSMPAGYDYLALQLSVLKEKIERQRNVQHKSIQLTSDLHLLEWKTCFQPCSCVKGSQNPCPAWVKGLSSKPKPAKDQSERTDLNLLIDYPNAAIIMAHCKEMSGQVCCFGRSSMSTGTNTGGDNATFEQPSPGSHSLLDRRSDATDPVPSARVDTSTQSSPLPTEAEEAPGPSRSRNDATDRIPSASVGISIQTRPSRTEVEELPASSSSRTGSQNRS